MKTPIEKIKKLFNKLNTEEQQALLKELSTQSNTATSIVEFAQWVQRKYRKSIEFKIKQKGPDHAPTVTATVITPWGSFVGTGGNQKIAKAKACKVASDRLE